MTYTPFPPLSKDYLFDIERLVNTIQLFYSILQDCFRQLQTKKHRTLLLCALAEMRGFEPPRRVTDLTVQQTVPFTTWVHLHYIKKSQIFVCYLTFSFGGEGGIRTHGTLQTHANFQDWCHKPTRPPLRVSRQ